MRGRAKGGDPVGKMNVAAGMRNVFPEGNEIPPDPRRGTHDPRNAGAMPSKLRDTSGIVSAIPPKRTPAATSYSSLGTDLVDEIQPSIHMVIPCEGQHHFPRSGPQVRPQRLLHVVGNFLW